MPASAAASSSNKPVKHHHVNRAYLKYFCLPNGTYYQYIMRPGKDGLVEAKWAGGNPNTTGWVEHLYDSGADTADDCYHEGELRKIERPAMAGIERLFTLKADSFDYQTGKDVVVYIAAMAMRSPHAMGAKTQLDPLISAGVVQGDYQNNPGPEGILKDLQAVRQHLPSIQWHLYWFDGQDGRVLVTSDRPVGLFAQPGPRYGEMLTPFPIEAGDPGNWAKQAIFTFPLSPTCAAIGFKGPRRQLECTLNLQVGIECDDRLPAWVNSMSAWQASRVYTRDQGAIFLLPNPPGGPGKLEFTPRPTSGIYVPVPRNRLGTIEEFIPLADRLFRAHAVPVDPDHPAALVATVQALRRNGCDI